MKAIYAIVYIEAGKSQDFKGVWTCDLILPVRHSNQLSYEATDVGSWSFVGPKEPPRNECEVIYEIFHTSNCRCEMEEAMILAIMKVVYAVVYIEAWKSQDFKGVWTCDLKIPVRHSNLLSYEATDVGRWSFVGCGS